MFSFVWVRFTLPLPAFVRVEYVQSFVSKRMWLLAMSLNFNIRYKKMAEYTRVHAIKLGPGFIAVVLPPTKRSIHGERFFSLLAVGGIDPSSNSTVAPYSKKPMGQGIRRPSERTLCCRLRPTLLHQESPLLFFFLDHIIGKIRSAKHNIYKVEN